jgi:dihydroorotase
LSLARVVDLTSSGPARIFGVTGKGRIVPGYDADFTVVDLKARRRIENAWMANKSGWTPFAGMATIGWAVATIIRGRIVMRDGTLVAPGAGKPVRFLETLVPDNEA